jgi:hypothetical protein
MRIDCKHKTSTSSHQNNNNNNNNNPKHAKIFSSHLAIREGIECTMCSSGSISIVACTYTTKHLKGEDCEFDP